MRLPAYIIAVVVVSVDRQPLLQSLFLYPDRVFRPAPSRVAQSGNADVTGTDSAALQKAADMLHPATHWSSARAHI